MNTKIQTANRAFFSTELLRSFIASARACRTFGPALLGAGLIALSVASSRAAILSWSGGSATTANWNDSANWGSAGIPGNGDTLLFTFPQPRQVNTNNIAGLILNQIRFIGAGGGYAIYGNSFTLTNSIEATNTVGANVISNNITLGSPTNFLVDVATGAKLTLGGTLSGSVGLAKSGGGTNLLAGGFSNTYAGSTVVSNGWMELFKNGAAAAAIPHDLIIGDGINAATVRDLAVFEIADTANITVNRLSTWDLNGHSETITALTLSGGTASSGAGTLTLSSNLTTLGSATTATISGSLSLGTATRTISVGSGTAAPDLLISADISGNAGAGIVKTGAGQMTLSGNNTFSGPFTMDGFVILASDTALGANGSATNGTTVNANGFLLVQGANIGNEFLSLTTSDDFRSSGVASWAGPITLNANVFVNVFGGTFTNTGAITGAGGFTQGQTGTLILAGTNANTYSGTTTVGSGTLFLARTGATGLSIPGSLVISSNATVQLGANWQIYSPTNSVTMADTSLFDLNGFAEWIGPLTMTGAQITTGAGLLYLGSNLTVNASSVAMSQITGNANLNGGVRTINCADGPFSPDFKISANLGGAGASGILKTGAGEVSLSGTNNTYAGATTVNDGNLWAQDNNAFGNTNTAATVNSPGEITLYGSITIGPKPLTLNGAGPYGPAFGALSAGYGTSSWAGNITLASNTVISVFSSSSDVLTLSGVVSGGGALTKVGPGTLTFSGSSANTYTSTTTVTDGTLALSKTGGVTAMGGGLLTIGDGTGAAASAIVRNFGNNEINNDNVTINSDGQLDLNGFNDLLGTSVILNGGSDIINSGSGMLTLVNGTTVAANATGSLISGNLNVGGTTCTFTNPSGTSFSINASVSGSATVLKSGQGTVFLNASNSYTGLTVVQQGWLYLQNSYSLGSTAAGTVVSNGATLAMSGNFGVTNEALTLNGPGEPGWGALDSETGAGTNYWTGPITLNADSPIAPFLSTCLLSLTGVISGPGGLIEMNGTGTLVLEGGAANTYAGTTTVKSGTLRLNKTVTDGAVPGNLVIGDGVGSDVVQLLAGNQIANTAAITIASSGRLDMNNQTDTTGSVDGSGQIDLGSGILRAGADNGSTSFTGVILGTGSLFKFGTGAWTLTGTNTYTGTTTVSAGTLLVNGLQPQSPVAVNGSATLGGSGTIGNLFVFGSLAPGNSPGMLTCSNEAFSNLGDYYVELAGPVAGSGYDQLNVRGTNNLGSATLHVTPAFTTPVGIGQTFTIINNDGAEAIVGTFNGLPNNATIAVGGFSFRITYFGTFDNDVTLTLLSVPSAILASTVTAGSGNHSIDPNGCNNLDLVITNTSGSTMNSISATLSTTTPGVLITQPYSVYPNIAASRKGTNSAPFQISTLPTFVCGTNINLQLSVSSSLGSFTMNYVLPTGEPAATPLRSDVTGNVAIPDPGAVDSTNVVSGFTSGPLTKVVASLYITHPSDSDLTNISLVAPDGTTVLLSSANGGLNANYGSGLADTNRTIFDDSAATAITGGSAPFVGAFRPQSPLSAFNGNATPNGNWHLHLADGFGGSAGTLRGWSLFLYGTTCAFGSGACDYCLTSISGSLTAGDLSQTNRLNRNGVVASCGAPKAFPGSVAGSYHYHPYAFTNTSASDACVTVLLTSGCSVQAGVYLNAFDRLNLTNNYLGDSGDSTPLPQTCSVTISAGAKFLVVVAETVSGSLCGGYTLQLSGLPCPPPILNIQPVSPSQNRIYWDTSAGGYLLESVSNLTATAWGGVTNEPIVNGGNYNVTNSSVVPTTNRFYRLNKP